MTVCEVRLLALQCGLAFHSRANRAISSRSSTLTKYFAIGRSHIGIVFNCLHPVGAGAGEGFVSNVLIPPAMRSLRDVDEAISIELDPTGTQWAARSGNR